MKNLFKSVLLLVFCIVYTNVFSQDYVEKSPTGEKVYYRIMNAAPQYAEKSLEDNIRNSQTSDYLYLLNDSSCTNLYQQWQLIPATSGGYYIKNRRSLRYIKIDENNWVGNNICPTYFSTKTGAQIFEIESIGNNQVTICYNDSKGDLRYLNAADSASNSVNIINKTRLQNSVNAWVILNENGTPTAIHSLTSDTGISVRVVNHQIVVNGCDDDNYKVYDLQGRAMNTLNNLNSGTYIVVAKGQSFKAIIP